MTDERSGIVLPTVGVPKPIPYDQWLIELDAAHRECVCDVIAMVGPHCTTCPTQYGWPCNMRRLLDEVADARAFAEGMNQHD